MKTRIVDAVKTKKITTVGALCDIYGGGCVTNDRGNGSAGPGFIWDCHADCDASERITQVSAEDDPEAWELAIESAQSNGCDYPTIVCVSDRDDTVNNGHQMIYAV